MLDMLLNHDSLSNTIAHLINGVCYSVITSVVLVILSNFNPGLMIDQQLIEASACVLLLCLLGAPS